MTEEGVWALVPTGLEEPSLLLLLLLYRYPELLINCTRFMIPLTKCTLNLIHNEYSV